MKSLPNFSKERKLKKQGYKYIAGCDEVGCGALAGPLFAAAIILSPKFKRKFRDSKKLSEKNREKNCQLIKKGNKFIGIGFAKKEEIEKLGLWRARALACKRALKNLPRKPDYVLFDGIDFIKKLDYSYEFTIKGDEKIASIACASIVAKVKRDGLMRKFALKYPFYNFDKNKGYGTKTHLVALLEHGPCEIHRKTYKPIQAQNNKK